MIRLAVKARGSEVQILTPKRHSLILDEKRSKKLIDKISGQCERE